MFVSAVNEDVGVVAVMNALTWSGPLTGLRSTDGSASLIRGATGSALSSSSAASAVYK